MAEPTLTQVFGAGATQTATDLIIKKADLAAIGLTATASNGAEALLNAILRLAKIELSPTNLDANIDQSIVISAPTLSVDERNGQNFIVQNYTIGLQKLISNGDVLPGDM
jgi:hypothetical protein